MRDYVLPNARNLCTSTNNKPIARYKGIIKEKLIASVLLGSCLRQKGQVLESSPLKHND